jgi:hypothetical protein
MLAIEMSARSKGDETEMMIGINREKSDGI